MNSSLNRRQFIRRGVLSAGGVWLITSGRGFGKISPNEKLNIGCIGTAGRAGDDLKEVSGQNIVALCDVDERNLAKAAQNFPRAKTYTDFRAMIDQKDIDAIVVGTPDHTHAVATMAALKSGRHVYCEKPLTHTISEARLVTETAHKLKLVTQIGTQIHAEKNYRRVVELVKADVIGQIREVHVWVSAVYGGMNLPANYPPAPSYLHFDSWLGPIPEHPYSPEWVPFKWRNWWAFGGGSLADFGCHYMDLPFWALDLKYPVRAEVIDGPPRHPDSTPPWLIAAFQFPARGPLPAVKLTWYHGGKRPSKQVSEDAAEWGSGVLFIGEKGMILSDYTKHQLLPEKQFVGFKAPAPTIPDSIGHHLEWIEACKTGGQTTCRFDYSGPLTETALLGNVAFRVGKKIEWDAKRLRATNAPEADQYIHHQYRPGWKL